MRSAYAILTIFIFSIAAFAQVPRPTGSNNDSKVEDAYLARDDGTGNAGEISEHFTTTEVPIHCVVMLKVTAPTPVKMLLVAVKVNGVRPESSVVSTAYTTKQGEDRVYFAGRPKGNWVAGAYRIDIFVGEKKEKSISFEIKGASSAPASASRFAPAKPARRRN